MVSSSCKHAVIGCNIEVTEPTIERTTGCVTFFMKRQKGGDPKLPSQKQNSSW